MTDPVLDLVNPAAISRTLSAAGFTRDETIGRQQRPFEPLAHTGGFRVRQATGWRAEIWIRQRDEQARANTYTRITEALTGRGYHVQVSDQPGHGGALMVNRYRPLTPEEWWALDHLAGAPQILSAEQLRAATRTGLPGVPVAAFSALHRSGLIALGPRIPVLSSPASDVQRHSANVISLSGAGMDLLIARNQARQARSMWRLIAPQHREAEPPPLMAGDPGPAPDR